MRRQRVSRLAVAVASVLSGGAALAQLPGDLDDNGEVNLADLAVFVGCLNGPDGIAVDPVCDPGNFDPDVDIDLRDFAGFQARFGFGQGPPQIDRFSPAPGTWVVDDTGLTEVKIGFSEPVIVPADAVDVWLVGGLPGGGTVDGFTTSYDEESFLLTVSFAAPLRDDQVTVVVDYTIEDVADNPLDGEILDPKNAVLPSGNDINGGQGVFRIRVLQGDANRDGTVDTGDLVLVNDSFDLCDGDPGFDAMADLNTDGCVDATDTNIVTSALGNQLPATDGTPLVVTGISISLVGPPYTGIRVSFNERLSFTSFNNGSCYLTDELGNLALPFLATPTAFGDAAEYFFEVGCSSYTINISNALTDESGELLTALEPQPCP